MPEEIIFCLLKEIKISPSISAYNVYVHLLMKIAEISCKCEDTDYFTDQTTNYIQDINTVLSLIKVLFCFFFVQIFCKLTETYT